MRRLGTSAMVWVSVSCGASGLVVGGKSSGPSLIDTASVPDSTTDSASRPEPSDPEPAPPLALCVNEWVASNVGGLRLADGTRPDWIELHNPGARDVSLSGWSIGDSEDPDAAERFDPSLTIPAGAELVLFADGRTELGGQHLSLSLDSDGESIALFAPDGQGTILHFGEQDGDLSMARTTDCCEGEGCWSLVRHGSPGTGNADSTDARIVLIPTGSTWRYLDTNLAPDAAWVTSDYSDAAWALGQAPLGYGDAHQVTFVSSGPEGARNISTWFRHEFFVDNPAAYHDLELDLLLDDGARVWLNGVELLQVNLPAEGDILTSTLAVSAVGGSNETAYVRYAIDGAVLTDSVNVLAIEVHQASVTSSDMGMDAQLTALRL